MARSATPATPVVQADGDSYSYSSGSEQSPSGWTHSTDPAGMTSQLTGATTHSGDVTKGQMASAREALRRKDRQIATLKRQVARLQQQLTPANGDGGGRVAVYRGAGALAPVYNVQVGGGKAAAPAEPQAVPPARRLAPAMKLTTLLLATFLCWVFLI